MNRRLLALVAAALLLLVAAGCGKNAGPVDSPGSTAGATTAPSSSGTGGGTSGTDGSSATAPESPGAPEQQPAQGPVGPLKVGEAAHVGPLTVTLRNIEVVREAPGLGTGYVYLLADLHVSNGGNAVYTINVTEHFRAATPEDKRAPYNMQAAGQRSPRLQGTLDPGQSTEGWMGHIAKEMEGTYKYQFVHPEYGEATWEFTLP